MIPSAYHTSVIENSENRIAQPARNNPVPRYIGFRTKRYTPVITSLRGASKGAGVPLPTVTNFVKHASAITKPTTSGISPSHRGGAAAGNANDVRSFSHRGITQSHRNMKPVMYTRLRRTRNTRWATPHLGWKNRQQYSFCGQNSKPWLYSQIDALFRVSDQIPARLIPKVWKQRMHAGLVLRIGVQELILAALLRYCVISADRHRSKCIRRIAQFQTQQQRIHYI